MTGEPYYFLFAAHGRMDNLEFGFTLLSVSHSEMPCDLVVY